MIEPVAAEKAKQRAERRAASIALRFNAWPPLVPGSV